LEDDNHVVHLLWRIERSQQCLDRAHELTVSAATLLCRITQDHEGWQAQEIERQVLRALGDKQAAKE
jgi:hypothetical protein